MLALSRKETVYRVDVSVTVVRGWMILLAKVVVIVSVVLTV